MTTVIKLTDRQAARWTVIAGYHHTQEQNQRAEGNKEKAQFHKDAYEFLSHIQSEAIKAGVGDKSAVCPICDGRGAV